MAIKKDHPILLMPMSLQIRRFKKGRPSDIISYEVTDHAAEIAVGGFMGKKYASYKAYKDWHDEDQINSFESEKEEFWIRWIPDEILMPPIVGRIKEEEHKAWEVFIEKAKKAKPNYSGGLPTADLLKIVIEEENEKSQTIKSAWVHFSQKVGIVRACQIARHVKNDGLDFDLENEKWDEPLENLINLGISLKEVLPEKIHLFVLTNGKVESLNIHVDVDRETLSIAVKDLDDAHWMVNFEEAVKKGMGVKISDQNQVREIKRADWIFAVGMNDEDSGNVLNDLLTRRNILGEFSLVAQDTATNNFYESTSFQDVEQEVENYLNKIKDSASNNISFPKNVLEKIHSNRSIKDIDLLKHRLKLNQQSVQHLEGADLKEMHKAGMASNALWDTCSSVLLSYLVSFLKVEQYKFKVLKTDNFGQQGIRIKLVDIDKNKLPYYDIEIQIGDHKEQGQTDDNGKYSFNPSFGNLDLPLKINNVETSIEVNPGKTYLIMVIDQFNYLKKVFYNLVNGRGHLPTIRVGQNPYGIVQVLDLENYKLSDNTNPESRDFYDKFWKGYVSIVKTLKEDFLNHVDGPNLGPANGEEERLHSIPRIQNASDNNRYEVMLNILRQQAIPVRYWVKNLIRKNDYDSLSDASQVFHKDSAENQSKLADDLSLLKELFRQFDPTEITAFGLAISKLEDTKSLLGRLVFFYFSSIKKLHSDGLPSYVALEFKRNIDAFNELLSNNDEEELSILISETLDLFALRLDAWILGLAEERAWELAGKENYRTPPIGVYAWLEKPGEIKQEGPPPSYFQAPSPSQAIAGTILRNAAINNGINGEEGPFMINLSSEQVRKGMLFLEKIRKGYGSGEVLGYELERAIRDKRGENSFDAIDVLELRKDYPLSLQENTTESNKTLTVTDGEKFLDARSEEGEAFNFLYDHLRSIQDAAADMVMAEVNFQIVRGNTTKAAACMAFLDGDALPPEIEFLQTHRTGASQDIQVFLPIVLPQEEDLISGTTIREIAYPIIANQSNQWIGSLEGVSVPVKLISVVEGEEIEEGLNISLTNDLSLQAIDLVLGGTPELESRLRYFVQQKKNDLSEEGITNYRIQINFTDEAIATLLAKIKPFRKLFHTNQKKGNTLGIEPTSGMSVFPDGVRTMLDKPRIIEILTERLQTLEGAINTTTEAFETYLFFIQELQDPINLIKGELKFLNGFKELEEPSDVELAELNSLFLNYLDGNQFGLEQREILIDAVKSVRIDHLQTEESLLINRIGRLLNLNDFVQLLHQVSFMGILDSLKIFPEELTINTAQKIIKHWSSILQHLKVKTNNISLVEDKLEDLSNMDARIDLLAKCISNTLGQKGAVLIPYILKGGEDWILDLTEEEEGRIHSSKFKENLLDYTKVRSKLKNFFSLTGQEEDTLVNQLYAKKNTKEEYYYSSEPSLRGEVICIIKIDEWDEFYPNEEEDTAIGIHYDAPQSEAPNALILAQPAKIDPDDHWRPKELANVLKQTVELMQIRMLSHRQINSSNSLGHYFPALVFADSSQYIFPAEEIQFHAQPTFQLFQFNDVGEDNE